ncbi:MAG: hypothetical protein KAJ64_05675, partial [Thermoplasmata archaeon]|nr:hypothetical protein [Thermoplasmata archaeon]
SQGPTRQSSVLIVDADYHEDGLADAYDWALTNNSWDVTIWDVYPSNTKPVSGNLMGYDLVVWVPSRDMQGAAGNGDAFNSVDENQVTGYLGLGGNFFLSNIYWSDWSSGGGFYNPGDFAYDVFGINDMNNQWSSYEDYVQGWGGDEVFDGFGPAWYDWNKYDWGGSKPNACDEINPMFATNGVEIVEDMMSSYNGGVYYDEGNFKSMFMGFPFEVMTQPYTDDFWARALEWFEPGSTAWDPASFEYQDVWWVCGDYPGSFPPTAYRVVPSEGLTLQSLGTSNVFQDVSCDHLGNPLFVSRGGNDMQYYDYLSESWYSITSGATVISDYDFFSVDFNENDRRFYFAGERNTDSMVTMWYTDAAPLDSGTAQAYAFNYLPIVDKILYSIAWNQVYDYGLAVGEDMVYKVQPYDYYGNGTLGYSVINTTFGTARDVSWDTDGYNEAGIVGSQGVNFEGTYWRFYDSNPQLIEEYGTGVIFTPFMTCAMKPPSSPKWLFIPSSTGDIRVNIEEKDESGELTINADQPHIITMNMWKQSDGTKASVLNKPLDADTTYTFFIEANYTIGGVDQWSDPTFQIDLMAWYDGGINLGAASVPGDPSWTSDEFRTRQFNVSFQTNTNTASLNYPVPGAGGPEFALDYWVDPASYGVDGSYNQIYLNITFEKLTAVAGSDLLMGPSATPWDVNSLLNADSWDFRAMAYIPSSTIKNVSYGEFGINEYASVSVIGSPGGSVPPGVTDYALSTPSRIYYSTNAPYTLNVSVPNIYKDGNPASPNWIDASDVKVQNTHVDADITNSEIHTFPTPFVGPGDDLHIWWIAGAPVNPTNHGTEMAGPTHSDFSAAGAFEVTEVYWWITVPAGLPEGVYRGTITITLWH